MTRRVAAIRDVVRAAASALERRGIDEARLDAEVLLAHVLRVDRASLFARSTDVVPPAERAAFVALVRRRASREPVAYLTGVREFYGREFAVSPAVLVPRPETETLVEEALRLLSSRDRGDGAPRVLDAGTGSGAIAVSIAVLSKDAHVVAIDRSAAALAVAAANAERHRVRDRVRFVECDITALSRTFAPGSFDVLVSNPPYVAEPESGFRGELAHEPKIALVADVGAFPEIYRSLIEAARGLVVPGGALVVETGSGQAETVRELALASNAFRSTEIVLDLAGIARVVTARRI